MASETTPLLRDDTVSVAPHPPSYTSSDHDCNETDEEVVEGSSVKIFPILLPLAVGLFLAVMNGTIVVSSYASIGSELNQLQNTSWITTGYMLTVTSFQPLYGKLSDIFGRKPCLVFAYTTFTLGCLFCGLSRTMNELIVSRALAGIGGGGMTTIAAIILSDVLPLRSRGTYQGMLNIVHATGSAAGAPLGGILADSIGWRRSFLLQVPPTILSLIVLAFVLDLPKRPKPEKSDFSEQLKRVDFGGTATLVFAVFFMLFALDRGGNVSWEDPLTVASIAASVLFAVLFGFVESKWAAEPLAPGRTIVNRTLIAAYLVNFFGWAVTMTAVFYISLYFEAVLGWTSTRAGVMLLPSIAGGMVGSLMGGLMVQVTGKYYLLTAFAYFLLLVGAAVLQLSTGTLLHSLPGVILGLLAVNVGNGSGTTTSLIALTANVGREDQAIVTALSYLFRSLGCVVGVSVGSSLVQGTIPRYLHARLSGQDVDEIIRRVRESLSYLEELDATTKIIVRASYEQAVHVTLWFALIFAALAFISSIFIKEKALTPKS